MASSNMTSKGSSVPRQSIVYGIPIEDPELDKVARKVLTCAFLGALFALANCIFFVVMGSVEQGLFTLGFGLLLPACGYFGVKNKSASLLSAFCVCSGCFSCCSLIAIVIIVLALGVLGAASAIRADCSNSAHCSTQNNSEVDGQIAWLRTMYIISLLIYVLLAMFYAYAVMESSKLKQLTLKPTVQHSVPPTATITQAASVGNQDIETGTRA